MLPTIVSGCPSHPVLRLFVLPAHTETTEPFGDPVRPVGSVEDVDGVNDARPSVLYTPHRRVHRVRPWPPSTSNNHRCTVGRQFVRSDEHRKRILP